MKKTQSTLFLILLTLFIGLNTAVFAQKGKVVTETIFSESLQNSMGENPSRAVSIYLPPGYESSTQRYPVIYFLHGFMGDNTMLNYMSGLMDYAIEKKKIRPFILVVPDEKTTYDGSFYSNSGLFGKWEDFTAIDLVDFVDENFRTIADKDSRGITGHSMGGYGALKIAMHYPDRFSSVYALSPGALAIVREYGPNSDTYKELSTLKTMEEVNNTYFGKVIIAFGRSWSPNPNKPPFYCDLPFEYQGEELIVHPEALAKWQANMPVHMIEGNLENLQKLKAIKLDWGRNAGERFTQMCNMFSQRLENSGITHFAEEYIGTHTSGIYTEDGRIPQQMLPFFDNYLNFEN